MSERAVLIDTDNRLGTVTKVSASSVELTLPDSLAAAGRRGLAKGTTGDFVFIDCDVDVVLGRIIDVKIPDNQRATLDHQTEREANVDPQGRIQLLATVNKTNHKVERGINTQPRIGDGVFSASGEALSAAIRDALAGSISNGENSEPILIKLGQLAGIAGAEMAIPPEKIFGRHCGVFGATGGGKSWTVSRLINEVVSVGGKCILFDPTGEFEGKVGGARECAFGAYSDDPKTVYFPSDKISEIDLFTLLRPSGQTQAPVLREAINSLRLANAVLADKLNFTVKGGERLTRYTHEKFGHIYLESGGALEKEGKLTAEYINGLEYYRSAVSADVCNFNIHALPDQIIKECIWPTNQNNPKKFGGRNDTALAHCNTLHMRAKALVNSDELKCMFSSEGKNFVELFENFMDDPKSRSLVVSFKEVSFAYNARELLLNTVGRFLLQRARDGSFLQQPVVSFLDEAHQFIGRSVGDEANSVTLDAFGLIAKEGRKYGLTTTIATQRPRDVPQDVLSQLGTLFVHRLTNERDRETIEKACGDLDKSAANFIPSLGQGEAIVLGPDLPAPLPLKMYKPEIAQQPSSHGPNYQAYWGNDLQRKNAVDIPKPTPYLNNNNQIEPQNYEEAQEHSSNSELAHTRRTD